MNIETINEIKEISTVLYYEFEENGEPKQNMWVGDKEGAQTVGSVLYDVYGKEGNLNIYCGGFHEEGTPDQYLYLAQYRDRIDMRVAEDWTSILGIRGSYEHTIMDTIIPLYKINYEEEVKEMTTQTQTITGLEILETAKQGDRYQSTKYATIAIYRNEEGFLADTENGKPFPITADFLTSQWVKVENEDAPLARQYVELEEALHAMADGAHVHFDLFLPDEEPAYDCCANMFLPAAGHMAEAEEHPLAFLGVIAQLAMEAQESENGVPYGVDPLKAQIPVEVLLYGKFFIEDHE